VIPNPKSTANRPVTGRAEHDLRGPSSSVGPRVPHFQPLNFADRQTTVTLITMKCSSFFQAPCRRCQLSGAQCIFEKPEKKSPAVINNNSIEYVTPLSLYSPNEF